MENIYLQFVFLFCLTIIPGVAIITPVLFLRWRYEIASRRNNECDASCSEEKFPPKIAFCVTLANSFACGVFLAVCFLSLLPASNARWETVLKERQSSEHETMSMTPQTSPMTSHTTSESNHFPISQLVVLVGFTIMFVVDKICSERWDRRQPPAVTVTTASTPTEPNKDDIFNNGVLTPTSECCRSESDLIEAFLLRDGNSSSTSDSDNVQVFQEGFSNHYISLKEIQGDDRLKMESPQSLSSDYGSIDNAAEGPGAGKILARHRRRANQILAKNWTSSQRHLQSIGGLNVLLLFATMAWHNLFEGLSLGIQTDNDVAISLFLGILIHGILLAIAISLTALKSWELPIKMSFGRAAIFLLILIGFRPAGILLGLGIGTSSGLGAHLMIAVLQSLSAGIFIHLTFFSLLPGEFGRPGESSCHFGTEGTVEVKLYWKLICLVFGWLSLAIIILLVRHSH